MQKDSELTIQGAVAIWTYLLNKENAPLIRDTVKRLNDLTRNADNPLSLKEAQAKIETKSPVQAKVVNWKI